MKALDRVRLTVRYEHIAPGEMSHLSTKKLWRIARPSHVTSDRRDPVTGAGREFAQVAIVDHSLNGFVQMHADERRDSSTAFLKATVFRFAAQGVRIKRLLTDNGGLPIQALQQDLSALSIEHTYTRPYMPQTNGKAKRFFQTCLRGWAYGRLWHTSSVHTSWLPDFLGYCSNRRAHSALGFRPPVSSLARSNLLTINSAPSTWPSTSTFTPTTRSPGC